MGGYSILIFSGAGFLVLTIFVALRIYYREVIKAKERAIIHNIRKQDVLAKELEYVSVEKKVMEKMLSSKFDAMVFFSTETQGTQRNTNNNTNNI